MLWAVAVAWVLGRAGGAGAGPCVEMGPAMPLCRGVGYTEMRLPNLLGHETLAEAAHQAASWLPLLNLNCHPDAQLFLCSLFGPLCLERAVYPCRGLCEAVRRGCEPRINAYGFPWPEPFRCSAFPPDGQLCVAPRQTPGGEGCLACNQALTYENILDNFCRADFVIRASLVEVEKGKLGCKKGKILKGRERVGRRGLRGAVLELGSEDDCCQEHNTSSVDQLVMGLASHKKLVPTFIMPWQAKVSKPFKRAIRMFSKLNCTDLNLFSTIGDTFPTGIPINSTLIEGKTKSNRVGPRRKKGKNKQRRRKNNSTRFA